MINKRNHTMNTVRHVSHSQCCSLGYSFNFSHKCPELVGLSSLQSYAKTRITILITALHSGQLPATSFMFPTVVFCRCPRNAYRIGNLYSASKTCMITFKYVVCSTTVVTNTHPCWADATFCYPVSLSSLSTACTA